MPPRLEATHSVKKIQITCKCVTIRPWLSDKVCSQRALQFRMPTLADIELANHPSHVSGKRSHRLHAFLVLCRLSWSLTVCHVPILRTDKRHIRHREILVQTVEGSRCPTPSTYHHTGCRLETQFTAQRVEHTIEQGTASCTRSNASISIPPSTGRKTTSSWPLAAMWTI